MSNARFAPLRETGEFTTDPNPTDSPYLMTGRLRHSLVIRLLTFSGPTDSHSHIPQKYAAAINDFYTEAMNPYLNFHRPCYVAVDTTDSKGKIRKTYPHNQIMTPWERLKTIPTYEAYLKPGITAPSLEHKANAMR